MEVHKKWGLRKVINAAGNYTELGGSLMSREALEAMLEAGRQFVNMDELLEKAGEIVARTAGVEAACITSGAAAGIALATAACMTGTNLAKIEQLPDTEGLKNEIILQRSQFSEWEKMVRIAGAIVVEVGYPSRTEPWQIESAINEKTAAILYIISHSCVTEGMLPLTHVVEIAKKTDVPVIVDAAAELPPIANLRRFLDLGADLAIFSGGKALHGPSDSGIVLGRKDLVKAVALNANSHSGIGRVMKIGKEGIMGLVAALEVYSKRNHKADLEVWEARTEKIIKQLLGLPHIEVSEVFPDETGIPIPRVRIVLDEKALGVKAVDIVRSLQDGDPSIWLRRRYLNNGVLLVDVACLLDGQEEIVAKALKEKLQRGYA